MTRSLLACAAFAIMTSSGCIFDDAEAPRITEVIVEPGTVKAGDSVTVTVTTSHFTLVDHMPDGEEHHHDDDPNEGHFHIYLDNLLDNPLAMPHVETFEVQIPEETEAGTHQLIVRLQHASHMIIEPQVISAAPITVE